MAVILCPSLLLFSIFIITPLQYTAFASASNSNKNPISQSKADNNGGVITVEVWCVAKNNAEDTALQTALDWACGPGGSDCRPIQQDGPCYDPKDIQKTASYAFNDYFLRNGLTQDSCRFDNTAALTSLNPSHHNCKFPSSFTVNNNSLTGSLTTTGVGTAGADLSGGGQVVGWWGRVSIAVPLVFAITRIFI